MLARADIDYIARIGNLSQECIAEDQFAEIMTQELLRLFDSNSAAFLEIERPSGKATLNSCTSYGIDSVHGTRYLERYHRSDPCYQKLGRLMAAEPQASVSTDQVIESEYAYVNSEYYQSFMRATGVHKSLVFTMASRGQPVGLVGLHRKKGDGDYAELDHLKARLVAPYLSTAIMFRYKDRSLRQKNLLKDSILKSSNVDGYLLFDGNLRCMECGGVESLPLLRCGAGGQVLGMPCDRLLPAELAALIRGKLASHARRRAMPLTDYFDNLVNSAHVRIEALRNEDGETHVLFLQLKSDIDLVSEQRMDYFNLTRRQQEIARMVQLGFTNPQISATLGISAKTVENHLTQIYAKTHTHNKTSLLRQLHV